MNDNSRFLEPELAERLSRVSPARYRQLALYVAERTIHHFALRDKRIVEALQALHAGKSDNTPEHQALVAMAEEWDDAAIDAQQQADEAGYNLAFSKARAVSALASAFEPDPEKAVLYTLYEAYHAVDQNLATVLGWLADFAAQGDHND
jgi:hypothetical protein